MKLPSYNEKLAVTMSRKWWFRLQSVLSVLDDCGFTPERLVMVRDIRKNFNRALQSANAVRLDQLEKAGKSTNR